MLRFNSYVICTSPRSGSTLLCRMLAATGEAGNPQSYFHAPSILAWQKALEPVQYTGTSERELLAGVLRQVKKTGQGESALFGLRLQQQSHSFLFRKLALLHPGLSSDVQRFNAQFGRTAFIYLSRENKIAQAVSFVKAQQTGLWHRASDGTELERLSPPQAPFYDYNAILQRYLEAINSDRRWEQWIRAEGLIALRINYESLSARPLKELKNILSHLGVDRKKAEFVFPEVAKLADGLSAEWEERFSREFKRSQ